METTEQKTERERSRVKVVQSREEGPDQAIARVFLRPSVTAASSIRALTGDFHEINSLAGELSEQIAAVQSGNLGRPESLLVAQMHTLDALFARLCRTSAANMTEGYLDAADRYMRLALKAQSQCRTTIEALAEIKNPRPVAFVRQANISNGPQEVNNGAPMSNSRTNTRAPARPGEIENPQNKLLEQQANEWMDNGAATTAGTDNPTLEALGALHGTDDRKR